MWQKQHKNLYIAEKRIIFNPTSFHYEESHLQYTTLILLQKQNKKV